jgi:RHS repeat-associated protein
LQETTDGNSIWYDYDDNGAVTFKDAEDEPNATYVYDLRGRLAQVQPEGQSAVDYLYNHAGIRVRASIGASDIDYIVDPYNHTGYAQVFKKINPISGANTVYVYGHDALAQAEDTTNPNYLLYDGHGSTRQLSNNVGAVVANYAYDAYGVMLGGNPAQGSSPATNLLYAGEHFDTDMQQYYLRARWYDQQNGRFNRMDPFTGNQQDPQSLHKYLYCHANPVNGVDPSGNMFAWVGFNLTTLVVVLVLAAIIYFAIWRPLLRPLVYMLDSTPMPQAEIDAAVVQMRLHWPSNDKMIELANGLSGAYPTYSYRMLPEGSYVEGLYFGQRMFVNQTTVENGAPLLVALILFAEFQHHPQGGGMTEGQAMTEFIEVRRELDDTIRTDAINNLVHRGTQNEY